MLIELHQRRQNIALGLRKFLLGGQPLTFRVENFQIAGDAADVTRVRERALVAQCFGEQRTLPAYSLVFW